MRSRCLLGSSGLRLLARVDHQLKTRLGINHWRNGTAYIQGPSSHQLAGRILELREALRHESRAPIPHIHDIQAPVAHSVGDYADCEPAPGTPVSGPGPRPLSLASFPSGSFAGSRQDFSGSGHSIRRERESRSTTFSNSHVSFMPPEGDTSEPQGFWFSWSCFLTLCFSVSWFWSLCLTLWNLWCRACRVLRRSPPRSPRFSARGIGSQHAFRRSGRGRLGCLSAFGVSPISASRPVLFFKSFLNLGKNTFSNHFSFQCPWLLCFLGAFVLFTLFSGMLLCLFPLSQDFSTFVSGVTEPHGFTRGRSLADLFAASLPAALSWMCSLSDLSGVFPYGKV